VPLLRPSVGIVKDWRAATLAKRARLSYDFCTPVSKPTSVVALALFVGSVGLAAWWGVDRWLTHRALAAHFANGKEFAARVLEEVGAVPDELRESSGVVVSRTQPGVFWSHNDSGDGPNLYAIDISGRLLARVTVTNAMARDWEDISSGPCPAGGANAGPAQPSACLYVADIGDNNEVRREVTIYIVVEPKVDGSDASPTVTARSFNFRYAEGPTDAEAVTSHSCPRDAGARSTSSSFQPTPSHEPSPRVKRSPRAITAILALHRRAGQGVSQRPPPSRLMG
jgi:hypothetical protein